MIIFGTEIVCKILTKDNAFCENQYIETHTSLADVNEFMYFPCLLAYWVQFSVRDDKILLSVHEFLDNLYSKGQAILSYGHQ